MSITYEIEITKPNGTKAHFSRVTSTIDGEHVFLDAFLFFDQTGEAFRASNEQKNVAAPCLEDVNQ